MKRPNSGWILIGLPNVTIYIYPIREVLIGAKDIQLSDHDRKSRLIIGLMQDRRQGTLLKDNYCF